VVNEMNAEHRTSSALLALVGLAAAGLVGCGMDFAPITLLEGLRVLAVPATPLEAGPTDVVTLRPVVWTPRTATVTAYRWRFCPITAGARAGYACALPTCETTLTGAADGSVRANVGALALECIAKLEAAGQLSAVGGTGTSTAVAIPTSIETVFTLEVEASDGAKVTAIARVPLFPLGAPATRNRGITIGGVRFGTDAARSSSTSATPVATLSRAGELDVAVDVDPSQLDPYVDSAGRSRTEEVVAAFFSTAGRWDSERATGTPATNALKPEELTADAAEAEIWVVVRDDRGAQDVAGPYKITIGP
jgi:hypothetical protein